MLGLDTSTAAVAACLLRGDGRAFEVTPEARDLAARPAHARELMPAVARVIGEAGLGFSDLDAVAVGIGPGGFTGLRIGTANARMTWQGESSGGIRAPAASSTPR